MKELNTVQLEEVNGGKSVIGKIWDKIQDLLK
jgi:hypothetical protein